ncbi:hypothetical protein J4E85_008117 [Alternaria conjuncta]|uniref:uncharacterized protein n=1 Tax=Alternaria conjuncta TaxID=181017 RepID=UPI00221E4E4E|nr:uncharacterized protein J4E85_008117 [Alternaria conjuncta]KAI4923959.1 hypothetical protein J4E85_008117 [Alternaria conjuncta]
MAAIIATLPLPTSILPALPVKLLIPAIALPVGMTMPSDMVIPLCMTIPSDMVMPLSIDMPLDIEDIADFMAEFIDEAPEERAASPVGAGLLSQAIVTGGAEGDIIGTIDVMVEELCASAMGAKAATAPMIVEERMVREQEL